MGVFGAVDLVCALMLAALPSLSVAGTVSLPSYPLAVKNPYLSAWVPGNQTTDAATAQPEFWAGQDLTWPVLARINGVTYTLFGAPDAISDSTAAKTVAVSYTSSHTIVNLTAGAADISLDFFSPVLPGTSDYAHQSLPYSYLTVTATSSSSDTIDVQILSGIDQTWTAQDGASDVQYNTSGTAGYYWFFNPNQILFTEDSDMATYGTIIFAATTGSAVTSTCGAATTVYSAFTNDGSLTAASTCAGTDLVAFSKDLGSVTSGAVTFVVGFDRANAINYLGAAQTPYYYTQWSTVADAVEYVFEVYDTVLATSTSFDAAVRDKAEAVSTDFGSSYADIVEASVRQTFGAIELTVPIDDLTASPSAFLKEISSDGNVNTVDVIFQSWPIFISLNPEYIRLLFQPVISYLALPQSEGWPEPYVIHDIGSAYPNATGHDNGVDEAMPVFETSSLLILVYAYQNLTGDTDWAQGYKALLEGYAEYLVDNTLYPASQLTSIDAIAASANQTALAIQSTIALKAASIITGNDTYATIAASFAKSLYDDALGLDGNTLADSTHFTYNYGASTTWNVLFAAFSDVVLGLDTFPTAAWDLQSTWYLTVIEEYGLPFAGPITDATYTGAGIEWGLADWNVVAASVSSTQVQQAVVNTTHAFLTNGLNTVPFGTKYYVEGPDAGLWIANEARSTVGSNFAILALQQGIWGTGF